VQDIALVAHQPHLRSMTGSRSNAADNHSVLTIRCNNYNNQSL
jgi:hypothetical protein